MWQDYEALIVAVSTLVGGLAAAASVFYAAKSLRAQNSQEVLQLLKVVAVKSKVSVNRVDRLLSWPLFLEISESFSERLTRELGEVSDKAEFRLRIENARFRDGMPRWLAIVSETGRIYNELVDQLDELEVLAVELSQRFPISGHIIQMCARLLRNLTFSYTSRVDVFQTLLDGAAKEDFWKEVEGNSTQELSQSFSVFLADAPMMSIQQGAQEQINDLRRIVSAISDELSASSYSILVKQQAYEIQRHREVVDKTDTGIGDIRECLTALRVYFSNSDWDATWAAFSRLEASYKKK